MGTREIITMSMAGTSINHAGRDVVLYLDEEMQVVTDSGQSCYLPVIAVAGTDGYAEFLAAYRRQVAAWFGDDFEQAQNRLEEINLEFGYGPQRALDLVSEGMRRAKENDRLRR